MSTKRPLGLPAWELALYAAFTAALLPLMALRDFSVDNELRYLSIADEALRDGSLFSFHNHGLAYADKPPLYLWIVMLGRALFGNGCMLFLSLFSLVPAFATAHAVGRLSAPHLRWRLRLAEHAMLLTCGYFFALAFMLRMDMLMTMFIALALCCFWRERQGTATAADRWLFPIYLFLALFTKGPYGLLFPLLGTTAFLAYKGELRAWPRYWGGRTWAVLLGLAALWLAAVYAEGGPEYFDNLVFRQTLDRSVRWVTHKHGWHYYLWSTWYAAAPWSLTMAALLLVAWRKRLHFNDLQHLCLLFGAAAFVLLSCVTSKMEVYLLPAYPFLVSAAALTLPKLDRHRVPVTVTRALFAVLAAGGALLALFTVYTVASGRLPLSSISNSVTLLAALLLTVTCGAAFRALARQPLSRGITLFVAGFLLTLFVGGFHPALRLLGYSHFCGELRQAVAGRGVERFAAWQMIRAENMDVLLDGRPVQADMTPDSLANLHLRGVAYIVPVDSVSSLPAYYAGRDTLHVGGQAIILLP